MVDFDYVLPVAVSMSTVRPGVMEKAKYNENHTSELDVIHPILNESDIKTKLIRKEKLCRSEERRVGKECRSRWSP